MRYAIVGTGARAQMWARELARHGDLVALSDVNPARIAVFQKTYAVPGYEATRVREMLTRERVDVLVVCTVDATHDEYIVAALEAGCDAITEKPMTTGAGKCLRILEAERRTGKRVTVGFNYRYHPVHELVRAHLPAIGEIGSVHFEWLLDVRHGADYFRRWHRDRANSGGLLVHKSTHHFDLVNWWLGATPERVTGHGRLFFYGEAGRRHGYARDYMRAHGSPSAVDDPFALRLADNAGLRELYLEAESFDGYLRDLNVFAEGVTIEDDLAVLVRYDTGATMSYHLTAYAPWEGYRIAFNGSRGRLELDLVESDHVAPGVAGEVKGHSAALHGVEAARESGSVSLRLRPFWEPPIEIEVPAYDRAGHGGADARMVAALLAGRGPDAAGRPPGSGGRDSEVAGRPPGSGGRDSEVAGHLPDSGGRDPDAAGQSPGAAGRGTGQEAPSALDGAKSLLVGLAANESIRTERSTRVSDLLDLGVWEK